MVPIIRNIVIIFLLLSIAYVILSFTARVKHRVQLESEYKTQSDLRQMSEEKEVFVARGMKRYGRSYKPRLILGVYIIPGLIMGFLIYLAQFT
jgi:hypothetical protein